MKKARRIVTLILGCAMLLGVSLSASAGYTFPYNMGPCPSCNYPNSGEFIGTVPLWDNIGEYKCGHCDTVFYYWADEGVITP